MADLEHNVPLLPDSVFEPGSVTKQFTAAAVLLLAQDGKLSLDDPVRKYIPELPDYGTPLTIRHLLNHTSGLRDWGNEEGIVGWPRTTRDYTHAHVLDILSRQHALNYPPGAEYSYTNSGYNLAAILVSRVAGESLPAYTRRMIFSPLGMGSTQWRDDFRRIVKDRAIAYSQSGGTFRQDMPFEDVYGNGGLLTTVGDLLRWNRNFVTMEVGGPQLIEAQLTRGKLTDGRTIAYAAGLMILHYKGLDEVSHSGSTAGYSAWLGRYPAQKVSVAVLCNLAGVNATQLGHQVADIYLGSAAKQPAVKAVKTDAAALTARAGLYRSVRDHHTITVGPQDRAETPEGPQRQFVTDSAGRVVRMKVVTEIDPNNAYEKVELASPTPEDLAAMAGTYTSDEAELTLHVQLESGKLVLHRRPDASFALTPAYRDGFNSGLGSVRFIRDPSGQITELSVGDSRVWDLRFRRVR
jgi:CubicO group peptidase (beta-lactamase class C family)